MLFDELTLRTFDQSVHFVFLRMNQISHFSLIVYKQQSLQLEKS